MRYDAVCHACCSPMLIHILEFVHKAGCCRFSCRVPPFDKKAVHRREVDTGGAKAVRDPL